MDRPPAPRKSPTTGRSQDKQRGSTNFDIGALPLRRRGGSFITRLAWPDTSSFAPRFHPKAEAFELLIPPQVSTSISVSPAPPDPWNKTVALLVYIYERSRPIEIAQAGYRVQRRNDNARNPEQQFDQQFVANFSP